MSASPRISAQTRAVLQAFLSEAAEWCYGYQISHQTNLKSGTLYPILMRLADARFLQTRWEESPEVGRPARHMYRLTASGLALARQEAGSMQKPVTLRASVGEAGS